MTRSCFVLLFLAAALVLPACSSQTPTPTSPTLEDQAAATNTPIPPAPTASPSPQPATETATPSPAPATATATMAPTATSPQPSATLDDHSDDGSEASDDEDKVTIAGFSFSPSTLQVKVGTKVEWKNQNSTSHTVTSDDGVFGSGTLRNGGSFEFTFNEVGTFYYHCNIHPAMSGVIVVVP
jgi:plastocyanin